MSRIQIHTLLEMKNLNFKSFTKNNGQIYIQFKIEVENHFKNLHNILIIIKYPEISLILSIILSSTH